MAETIKGISVHIGADTKDFIKELKKVDKEINYSEKQARELQKQLELKFDSKLFSQAQKKVQDDLAATEQKAKAINKQLKELEDSGNVDTDGYKKLQVELAKTETQAMKLNTTLDKINDTKTNRVSNSIKNFVTNLKATTAVAVGAAAGVYKLVDSTAKYGANIQDLSDRLGISAEEIQRFNYIAMQSGVETEQLVKSIAKARDAVGTAISGVSNNATKSLEVLFGDLSKVPTSSEAAFTAIIDQLSKMEDSTMQAYYANEIFGEKLATNLIPLINNGAEKINQLNREFKSLGSLTNEEIQNLADFDDLMNLVSLRIKNITYKIGNSLMPLIRSLAHIIETTIVPALELVMEVLDPIIKAITWVNDKISKVSFAIMGKGWLWGRDDDKDKKPENNENNYYNENSYDYGVPNYNTNNSNSTYEDNSEYNINVEMNANGDLNYDAKELADQVIKEIVLKKQTSGR